MKVVKIIYYLHYPFQNHRGSYYSSDGKNDVFWNRFRIVGSESVPRIGVGYGIGSGNGISSEI